MSQLQIPRREKVWLCFDHALTPVSIAMARAQVHVIKCASGEAVAEKAGG